MAPSNSTNLTVGLGRMTSTPPVLRMRKSQPLTARRRSIEERAGGMKLTER